MHLYELANEFKRLEAMCEPQYDDNGELLPIDEEMLSDAIFCLKCDLRDKAENCGRFIKNMEADVATYSAKEEQFEREAKRFKTLAKRAENAVKRVKRSLINTMKTFGETKIKTENFSFAIVGNAKRAIEIDENSVPETYKAIEYVTDKDKIREALEEGEWLSFARYTGDAEHLKIR